MQTKIIDQNVSANKADTSLRLDAVTEKQNSLFSAKKSARSNASFNASGIGIDEMEYSVNEFWQPVLRKTRSYGVV